MRTKKDEELQVVIVSLFLFLYSRLFIVWCQDLAGGNKHGPHFQWKTNQMIKKANKLINDIF